MSTVIFFIFAALLVIGALSFTILWRSYSKTDAKLIAGKLRNTDVSINTALSEDSLKIVNLWDEEIVTNVKR